MHDLFGLIWILLASHQSLKCINSSKQAFFMADRDDCHSIRQVSSAKRWGVLLMAFGKSLIYIRKSKGYCSKQSKGKVSKQYLHINTIKERGRQCTNNLLRYKLLLGTYIRKKIGVL